MVEVATSPPSRLDSVECDVEAACPQRHRSHPSFPRQYGVRGNVGETLSVADAEAVSRAFAP